MTPPLIFTSPSKGHTPVDSETLQEVLASGLPDPRRVVAMVLLGEGEDPTEEVIHRHLRALKVLLDEYANLYGQIKPFYDPTSAKFLPPEFYNTWYGIKTRTLLVLDWALSTRVVPVGSRKAVEALRKTLSTRGSSDYMKWWERYMPLFQTVFDSVKWPPLA